ncbi:hypothetical protein J6590_078267 [Homalodisca vitripennis]|nr:hypothetical protein J6590_078267 [Homalodisca vitripennis]
MPLLKLTGTESVLTLHLEHPIHLDPNEEYYMALVGFYSENNIYNLLQHAKVYFWDLGIHFIPKPLILQCGYWTIEKLEKSFRDCIKSLNLSINSDDFKIFKDGDKISINSPIKFYLDKTVSDLLGFEKSDATNLQKESSYFNSNENVIASNPPNLRAVDVIEIHCNIVNNSLVNHDVHSYKHLETAILYSFSPNVPHGYKISQSPQEKHYIPLRSGLRKIQQITITLVDQNNQLLQNNHANNIVYLDLISKSQTHTYSQFDDMCGDSRGAVLTTRTHTLSRSLTILSDSVSHGFVPEPVSYQLSALSRADPVRRTHWTGIVTLPGVTLFHE